MVEPLLSRVAIYVVSAKNFVDRQCSIAEQMSKDDLEFEFIWEFDADELSTDDLARFGQQTMRPEAKSCVLKHLEAQSLLLRSDKDACLILEDDAILSKTFKHDFGCFRKKSWL